MGGKFLFRFVRYQSNFGFEFMTLLLKSFDNNNSLSIIRSTVIRAFVLVVGDAK